MILQKSFCYVDLVLKNYYFFFNVENKSFGMTTVLETREEEKQDMITEREPVIINEG